MSSLTLIIASNREHKDYKTQLPELLESPYLDQIILVNKYSITYPSHPKLVELIQTKPGVSKARNMAIEYALKSRIKNNAKEQFNKLTIEDSNSSAISHLYSQLSLPRTYNLTPNTYFAFTDDDCILSKSWLKTIHETFEAHPEISLLFGQTKPHQPEKHQGLSCPSTFSKTPNEFSITTQPCKHWEEVGFSNNMAIRAEVFQKMGGFKEWLGPGSIGSNCEDGELTNRCLIAGYKIGYEPGMLVYHNKWLDEKGKIKQDWSYTCGEMACYGWFALAGHTFGKRVVKRNLLDLYYNLRKAMKTTLFLKPSAIRHWIRWWQLVTSQIWGLGVAIISNGTLS